MVKPYLNANAIIPIQDTEAQAAAQLRVYAKQQGRVLPLDALIAGTALAHNLIVATCNTADFQDLQVKIFNP